MIVATALALHLTLGPYRGKPLPGAIRGTAKFGVRIDGPPGTRVHLRSVGVPHGWLASFCTDRVCAPFAVFVDVPRGGRTTVELQLVRTAEHAPPPAFVAVSALHGPTVRTRYSRGVL